MLLTKEAILGADDLKKQLVKVPEWGGEVLISMMTGEARDAWEQSLVGEKGAGVNMKNLRARLVAATAVNEKGERLFSEKDVEALGLKCGKALERCAKVAQRLNAITDKDVEDAAGN